MNRNQKRRLERLERKQLESKQKEDGEKDFIVKNISKFMPSMKSFYESEKGDLFDWILTLDCEDLKEFSSDNLEMAPVAMYLAIAAHCLTTGEECFADKNPDTKDSTLYTITNCFFIYCATASLCKNNLIKANHLGTGFFDWKDGSFEVEILNQ